jgi:cell division protein FtsB
MSARSATVLAKLFMAGFEVAAICWGLWQALRVRQIRAKKFIVGAIMKKVILSVLAVASLGSFAGTVAHAAQNDDVLARIEALEKKVAALSEEKNAALRENQVLRQQNATLKPATRPQATAAQSAAAPIARRSDPLRAYASAPPMTYKGRIAEAHGQLRIWGEGGATWAGGDPNLAFYNKQDFTQTFGFLGAAFGTPVGVDMKPKLGYEAAAGFDYRFAESPWHVSGQFRYGENRSNVTAPSSGNFDIAALNAAIAPGGINGDGGFYAGAGGNQIFNASGRETHWLADLAVGRDILGSGASAMQLKFGLRLAELEAGVNSTDTQNTFLNFTKPVQLIVGPGAPFFTTLTTSALNTIEQTSRFFGAGPRIGVDGSVPFAGQWAFDYTGDGAVLFGTQRFSQIGTTSFTTNPSLAALGLASPGILSSANTDERSATVFNADLQAGFSYWVTPSVKVSASYRVDAFFNVITALSAVNDPTKLQKVGRYYHGPRIGLTGQF